jgi:antitoxin HicB
MPKTPEEYLEEPYARMLIPDEHGMFAAQILEFPGCYAQGASADEAFQNLERAAKAWIQASLDQGHEIPPPSMNPGYGGKVALRLSRSLHRQAVRMAELDRVSLNQFLVTAIAARVGAEDFYNRLVQRLEQRVVTMVSDFTAHVVSTLQSVQPLSISTPLSISQVTGPPEAGKVISLQRGAVSAVENIPVYSLVGETKDG